MHPERDALGWIEGGVHTMPIRVYYEDTDAAGLVYYANYLKFVERARTNLLRLLGISHSALAHAGAGAFAVHRCTIEYLAPARLDDYLEVRTQLAALSGARIDAVQDVRRDDSDIVRTRLDLVFIGPGGRPRRLPAPVRDALRSLPIVERGG